MTYRAVEGLVCEQLEWYGVPPTQPPTSAVLIDDETGLDYPIRPILCGDERVEQASEPQPHEALRGGRVSVWSQRIYLRLGSEVQPLLPRQSA